MCLFLSGIYKETISFGLTGRIVSTAMPQLGWGSHIIFNFTFIFLHKHLLPLKSTSSSVCEASASCLTSLIYTANKMFLLTHIMQSLLMKKTIPGGQPRGPLKPASKNSSNAQRDRSSKTIFHTMK